MPTEDALYLGLCVVALVVAAHAPEDQRNGAVTIAALLLANWLLCAWTYAASSPQAFARAYGVPLSGIDLWVFADTIVGASAIALSKARAWGWALWGISVAQLTLHYFNEGMSEVAYLYALDKLLLAQIAVVIWLGSKGVGQRVGRWRDRVSRMGRMVRATACRAEKKP